MIKPKVLVVDDNKDIRWLIKAILEENSLSVDIAYDGESALNKINKHSYAVMVSDYELPDISGLTVLKEAHQIRPSLQTIMISAYGNESVRARAKELGAYAFLDKPFNIDELVRIIKKSLREKRRCINEADLQSRDSGSSGNVCSSSSFSSRESSSNPANSVRASKSLIG